VNSILHRDRPENGKPIGIKRIVNEKDCYIDGKNMKTNMRYIPEFQEVSRMKVVVGGRGGGAVNCDMSNPCYFLYML
jgi:hypothetical protein